MAAQSQAAQPQPRKPQPVASNRKPLDPDAEEEDSSASDAKFQCPRPDGLFADPSKLISKTDDDGDYYLQALASVLIDLMLPSYARVTTRLLQEVHPLR